MTVIITGVDDALPAAGAVAAAVPAAMSLLADSLPRGWARRIGASTAVVTMAPAPTLNGVWVTQEDTPAEDVEAALDAVAATGAPHSVQLRPEALPVVGPIAHRRGMLPARTIPLMAAAAAPSAIRSPELTIRRLQRDELDIHVEVAAPAFGAPAEVFRGLFAPALLERDETRMYVGEVAGHAVTTAMSLTAGDGVGIFNVATPERHRGRGYAGALTGCAHADGLEAGASWAWLQSSDAGYGLYQRMGFATLEWWECWVAPS